MSWLEVCDWVECVGAVVRWVAGLVVLLYAAKLLYVLAVMAIPTTEIV